MAGFRIIAPVRLKTGLAEAETGMGNLGFAQYCCPITLTGGGMTCQIASDALVAVSRDNTVVRRSVSKPKGQGTIKESWAVGDWNINISGIIVAESEEQLEECVQQLSSICALRESLEVTCRQLNEQHDITRIAVAQLQLPFTPGMLNQQFTIVAYSDSSYQLLEEI